MRSASRGPRSSWSLTTPGSPRTPTARSSCGTARSARSPGQSHERGNRDRAGHSRDQHAYEGETVSAVGTLERDASRSGMNGSGTVGLGLRLAVNGGREAVTRLVILAVAVGLGVGLLLTAMAANNAVTSWNNRHAWFWTGTYWAAPGPATGVAPLWWHPTSDIYGGQTISRFDVAATGASSPVPPGLSHDPAPGTYDASPALAALLRSVPADQLADRYPGHLAGIIGDAALPSPNSLVIVVGRTPAQLATAVGSVKVAAIATTVPGSPGGNVTISPASKGHRPQLPPNFNPNGLKYTPADTGIPASGTDLILSVVALAVLLPVLIFIGTATRLSAARREQRFAAMRLVGATRTQVSVLAAVESTAAALLGVAAGFAIFFGLRIPVAGIPFVGQPFFPGQLTLSLFDVIVVAAGVPVVAAVAARRAAPGEHLPARRHAPGDAEAAWCLAGGAAAPRPS